MWFCENSQRRNTVYCGSLATTRALRHTHVLQGEHVGTESRGKLSSQSFLSVGTLNRPLNPERSNRPFLSQHTEVVNTAVTVRTNPSTHY